MVSVNMHFKSSLERNLQSFLLSCSLLK